LATLTFRRLRPLQLYWSSVLSSSSHTQLSPTKDDSLALNGFSICPKRRNSMDAEMEEEWLEEFEESGGR
jgi:hypothetical protein